VELRSQAHIAAANHFLEMRFLPAWEERFTVAPRRPRNAHRELHREQRLEEIVERVGNLLLSESFGLYHI